jgi:hypothetical protein
VARTKKQEKEMINYELYKLRAWREILGHIRDEYGDNRSIGNVLQNINARIKSREKLEND